MHISQRGGVLPKGGKDKKTPPKKPLKTNSSEISKKLIRTRIQKKSFTPSSTVSAPTNHSTTAHANTSSDPLLSYSITKLSFGSLTPYSSPHTKHSQSALIDVSYKLSAHNQHNSGIYSLPLLTPLNKGLKTASTPLSLSTRSFARISDTIPDFDGHTIKIDEPQKKAPGRKKKIVPKVEVVQNTSNGLEVQKPLRKNTQQYKLLMNLQYLHANLSEVSHLPIQTQQFLKMAQFLRYLNLKESDIISLAQKVQRFFDLNPETDLQPKVSFLLNVGWTQAQVNNLLLRQPHFFLQNLHNIAFKFQYLLHLGFKLYEFPYLLLAPWGTMSTRDIEARVRWLREFNMTESDIRDTLRVSTRLFTFAPQQLESGISVLSRVGFPIPTLTSIIRRSPSALQSTTLQFTLLSRTFQNLLGVSLDQFYSSFIGRWPHLNYVSPNNTYRLFSFLYSIGYTEENMTAFLRHQGTCLSIDLHEAAKRIDFLGKELFIPISLPYDRREFQLAAGQVLSHIKPLHTAVSNSLNLVTLRANRLTAAPLLNDRPNEHEVATIGEVYRLRLLNLITSTQFGRFQKSIPNNEYEEALSTGPLAPIQLFSSQIKVLKHSQIDDARLRSYPAVDPEFYDESFDVVEKICFTLSQRTLRHDRLYLASKVKQIASLDYETLLQTDFLTTGNVDEVVLNLIEDEVIAAQHSTPPVNLIPSHEDKDSIVNSYTTDGTNIIAVLNNRARVPLKLSLSTIGYKEIFVNLGLILHATRPHYSKLSPFPFSHSLFTRNGYDLNGVSAGWSTTDGLFNKHTFRAYIPSQLLTNFLTTHVPSNINSHLFHESKIGRYNFVLKQDDDYKYGVLGMTSDEINKLDGRDDWVVSGKKSNKTDGKNNSNLDLFSPQDDQSPQDEYFQTSQLFEKSDDGHLVPKDRRLSYLSTTQRIKKLKAYTYQATLPTTTQLNYYNDTDDFSNFFQDLYNSKNNLINPRKQLEFDQNIKSFENNYQLNVIEDELRPDFYRLSTAITPEQLSEQFPRHLHHIRNMKRVKARQKILQTRELYKKFTNGELSDEENDYSDDYSETQSDYFDDDNDNDNNNKKRQKKPRYRTLLEDEDRDKNNLLSLTDFKSQLTNIPVLDTIQEIENRINNVDPSSSSQLKNKQNLKKNNNKKSKQKEESDFENEAMTSIFATPKTKPLFDSNRTDNDDSTEQSEDFEYNSQHSIKKQPTPLSISHQYNSYSADSTPPQYDHLTNFQRFQRKLLLNNVDLWLSPPHSAQGYIYSTTPVSLTTIDFDTLSNYVVHVEQHMPHLAAMESGFVTGGNGVNPQGEYFDIFGEDDDSASTTNNKHKYSLQKLSPDTANSPTPGQKIHLPSPQFYPGLAPTLPPRHKRRFFVISKHEDRNVNRNYPSLNVMLDYIDGATDILNPQHMSLINASLPTSVSPLNVRPLPYRDLIRQPRSAREWSTCMKTLNYYNEEVKSKRSLSKAQASSRYSSLGLELMYNHRVKIYPSLYYNNRTPIHKHLLDVHLPKSRLDDPQFQFLTEVTHHINEHLALLTRLRLILQDRKDYLENRGNNLGEAGQNQSSLAFLNDIKYFFAHLSRVEWTFQKVLHLVQQPNFDFYKTVSDSISSRSQTHVSLNPRTTGYKQLFRNLLGHDRFNYYVSALTNYSYFSDYTRSKSWFLLYEPYKSLGSKIAGYHAYYSIWASISSRLAGLHPFRTSQLYLLRDDEQTQSSNSAVGTRRVELSDISIVASTSSFNFLNIIPGSPHSIALSQLARSATAITTSFSNRLLPRSSNTVLRAMGYTLDPRQVLWDAADRGVKPNTEKLALKHHITQQRAVGDIETINEKRKQLASVKRGKKTPKRVENGDDGDDGYDGDSGDGNAYNDDIYDERSDQLNSDNTDQEETPRVKKTTKSTKKTSIKAADRARSRELESTQSHLGLLTFPEEESDKKTKRGQKANAGKTAKTTAKKPTKKSQTMHQNDSDNDSDQSPVYPPKPRYYVPQLTSLDDWCNEVQDWAISKNPLQVPPPEIIEALDLQNDSLVLETDPVTGESHIYIYWHNQEGFNPQKKVHGIQSLTKPAKFFSPDAVQLNVEDPFFKDFAHKIWPSTYGEYISQFKQINQLRPDIPITPSVEHHYTLKRLFINQGVDDEAPSRTGKDPSTVTTSILNNEYLTGETVNSAAVLLERSTSGNLLRQVHFEEAKKSLKKCCKSINNASLQILTLGSICQI